MARCRAVQAGRSVRQPSFSADRRMRRPVARDAPRTLRAAATTGGRAAATGDPMAVTPTVSRDDQMGATSSAGPGDPLAGMPTALRDDQMGATSSAGPGGPTAETLTVVPGDLPADRKARFPGAAAGGAFRARRTVAPDDSRTTRRDAILRRQDVALHQTGAMPRLRDAILRRRDAAPLASTASPADRTTAGRTAARRNAVDVRPSRPNPTPPAHDRTVNRPRAGAAASKEVWVASPWAGAVTGAAAAGAAAARRERRAPCGRAR
jgi:hypothetical protein